MCVCMCVYIYSGKVAADVCVHLLHDLPRYHLLSDTVCPVCHVSQDKRGVTFKQKVRPFCIGVGGRVCMFK